MGVAGEAPEPDTDGFPVGRGRGNLEDYLPAAARDVVGSVLVAVHDERRVERVVVERAGGRSPRAGDGDVGDEVLPAVAASVAAPNRDNSERRCTWGGREE